MADIRTKYLGLDLVSPLILASAGITENVERMKKAEDHGAGAVVMKSLFEDEVSRKSPTPRFQVIRRQLKDHKSTTLYSYEQASEWGPERYAEEVAKAKATLKTLKIIPSINCLTPEGWVNYAKLMEEAGADAIELNTSCPHGSITFRGGAVENTIAETVKLVKDAVKIPVVAKISPMLTSPEALVLKLQEIGVDGVTVFNRFTGLEIDTNTEAPIMHGGYAGFGGPWAINYPLRWISQIRPKVNINIAGSSGVTCGDDVVKYLLVGCNAVQFCTAIYMYGYSIIEEFNQQLSYWMDAKGYKTIDEFRGKICDRIKGTKEVNRQRTKIACIENPPAAPCKNACPINVPVQAYTRLVAQRKFEEAWHQIQSASPFQNICGLVCNHFCEQECTRGEIDEPVSTRNIKRFVLEWGEKHNLKRAIPDSVGSRTEKVAVIGAGPAGLTAAHDLAVAGYKVIVFDKLPEAGGMMRVGIPRYRLPLTEIDSEVDYIKDLGVELQLNSEVQDLKQLANDYQAVCLAVGAHRGSKLGIPGEEAKGVTDGLSFLYQIANGEDVTVGRKVAIVGGGNTAIDAARSALRLGAETVYLVYRRTRDEMPANEEEIIAAEEEGVKIMYLVAPKEVQTENGKVSGLACVNLVLGEKDPSNRRRPEEVRDTDFVLHVDQVITAIGQQPELPFSEFADGKFDEGKLPSGVFAAGDLVSGPATVVEAIGSGRGAAAAIDNFLSGGKPVLKPVKVTRVVDKIDVLKRTKEFQIGKREKMPMISLAERKSGFDLVETGFDEETAVRESQRCLACGCGVGCDLCENICIYFAVDTDKDQHQMSDKCDGCGMCAQVCPNQTIVMKDR